MSIFPPPRLVVGPRLPHEERFSLGRPAAGLGRRCGVRHTDPSPWSANGLPDDYALGTPLEAVWRRSRHLCYSSLLSF